MGCQLLAAAGTEAILVPRATPPESWERWKLVLRANAVTCAAWVVSVNRPRPEGDARIGGPSVVIAPDGRVVVETTEPVVTAVLDVAAVETARRGYPGYLARPAGLYAEAWRRAAGD